MASDEVWDKTHRIASRLFIAAGIWMAILAYVLNPIILVGVIVTICLVSAICSYQLHKGSKPS
jgi:uncharacterized membrane protein